MAPLFRYYVWAVVLLLISAKADEEQAGALDLYPPTKDGQFNVDLDHFRYDSTRQFPLRYLAYDRFVATSIVGVASSAPIFLYCGNEGGIDLFYNNSGGIFEMAQELGAKVVFVEHRYYGSSLPFGPVDTFKSENLVYLSIEQTLADYAMVCLLPANFC
jgi:hypothetical protein